mmetsp:Transcript_25167/g.47784  ORF Transcript_25167/g.47784 Transcript_25167/m.47784 type:complete len:91 (-) Transcript_25167:10-282(-)
MLSPVVDIHIHLTRTHGADSPPPIHPQRRLLASDERQEHVESDLDSVEEKQAVLVGDELEVNSVHNRPHFPRSLASGEEVGLDLVSNGAE